MTEEQIAELGNLFKLVSPEFMTVAPTPNYERGGLDLVIHSPWQHGEQPVVRLILAMRDAFPRLLKEREELLTVCKAFVDRAKELNAPMTASEIMARNAIQEAEWP